jgi:flagellar protein FlbD
MIELTRLNGNPLVVNSDLIQYVESAPDTTLTLINGEKVVVRESSSEVIDLTIASRARLMGEAAKHCPGGLVLASGAALRALAADKAARTSADEASSDTTELDMAMAARRRRADH